MPRSLLTTLRLASQAPVCLRDVQAAGLPQTTAWRALNRLRRRGAVAFAGYRETRSCGQHHTLYAITDHGRRLLGELEHT